MAVGLAALVLTAAAGVVAAGPGPLGAEKGERPVVHVRSSDAQPWLASVLSSARQLGPVPSSQQVTLSLGLRGRQTGTLNRLLDAGETLSAREYDSRFGPDAAGVRAAATALRARGLRATWSPGDSVLGVTGSAAAVESAFGVHLVEYSAPAPGAAGQVHFYAPAGTGEPVLPAAVRGVVSSVVGLDSYPVLGPAARAVARRGCNGAPTPQAAGGYTPAAVSGMYNFGPLYQGNLRGAGQTVVFMEIDGYLQSDLDQFASTFGLPPFAVVGPEVHQAGGTGVAAPYSANCQSETELDLEVVHAMAPQAQLVVYDSGIPGQGPPLSDVALSLQAAIDAYPHAIFSLSLGWCEDRQTAAQFDSLFTQLTARGGTAFVSSGDNGAYARGCTGSTPTVENPADSPHAVAVGGTTAFEGQGGTYGREAAWGDPIEQDGSGGGLSRVFSRPAWQRGPGVSNQYSNGMRQMPDVASIGDSLTGWDIVSGGVWAPVGGTSAGAPLWAALMALTDQALAARHLGPVGLANAALYDFAADPGNFPAVAFRQVKAGTNLYYPATSGWNFATGLGSPNAAGVVDDFIAYEKGAR